MTYISLPYMYIYKVIDNDIYFFTIHVHLHDNKKK